jgi:predicted MPP superfamily phosphohydrolase
MSALGLASTAYVALFEPAQPTLERVTLRLPALPEQLDGLRVGQISDSHLGMPYSARNLAWAVERMRRERPELIALTGDLVSRRSAIPQIATLLRGLRAPLGVYSVPGNHDYWEGLPEIHALLEKLGIQPLLNAHRRQRWNGADHWLVGLDDSWETPPDFAAALQGVPRGACKLLLAHEPDVADEAARHGIAAQLSGHTHGGHLRLPLLGPFALPRHGWRYAMGHYQVGPLALYVSRGLSGPPFRLLCRPEATIFTLRCA